MCWHRAQPLASLTRMVMVVTMVVMRSREGNAGIGNTGEVASGGMSDELVDVASDAVCDDANGDVVAQAWVSM